VVRESREVFERVVELLDCIDVRLLLLMIMGNRCDRSCSYGLFLIHIIVYSSICIVGGVAKLSARAKAGRPKPADGGENG